jgi:hypothetical protein
LELVKILREVWSRKRLLALVLVVSLLVGTFLAYRPGLPPQSRQYQVWLASSNVLIDTSSSQVVDVGGQGPNLPTLAGRASLLANLMTAGPLKNAIARSAGVSPQMLVVVPPPDPSTPGVPPVPVSTAASRGIPDADATVLTLTTDETLPILHVVAQAPDVATARRLSGGTIVQLKRYLGSVAATQHIPEAHQLVLREFGTPLIGNAVRGLPRRFALVAALLVALFGCGAIVTGSWFIRSWRQIEAAERRAAGTDIPAADGADGAMPNAPERLEVVRGTPGPPAAAQARSER